MKYLAIKLYIFLLFIIKVSSFIEPFKYKSVRMFESNILSSKKENDYIDAEIINESDSIVPKFKGKGPGLLNNLSNNPIVRGIKKIIRQDDKSIERRKRNDKMNTMIDQAFEGTGLLGGGFKTIVKGFATIAADAFSESVEDIELVQSAAKRKIKLNQKAASYLGENLYCSSPISTMSSSSNINGNVKKTIQLVFQVSGDSGIGMAQISASVTNKKSVEIQRLSLQTPEGRSIPLSDGNSESGDIIDVDQIL